MNFKKLVSGSIVVAMLIGGMVGCSGKGDNGDKPADTKATTTTTVATTQKAQEEAYVKGTFSGKVYTNESIGIKYTMPEGYTFDSKEKLTPGAEMQATNQGVGAVIVMVQDMPNGVDIDEAAFIDIMKKQLDKQFNNPEYQELKKVTVADIELTDLTYNFTMSGQNMNQSIMVKQIGSKMFVINVTYGKESDREKMMAGFSKL